MTNRTHNLIVMKKHTTSNFAQTWITANCDVGMFFDTRWRPCLARRLWKSQVEQSSQPPQHITWFFRR